MSSDLERLKKQKVAWSLTDSAEYPFKTNIGGVEYKIRINDFPDEAMYTMLGDGEPLGDFDDWPTSWKR
ncbi:hypothetical protein [Marinobacter sp.]|uniref:hypothetical protein n=1 Tax=Marinobacter sp. TaxID=50741 RepID=UPI00384BD7D8